MRLSPLSPAMKAIPTVWDEVCKAFTQLGADPDLALGAVSQEKSPLENSQWLLCVRSSPPPPGSAQRTSNIAGASLGKEQSPGWVCLRGSLCCSAQGSAAAGLWLRGHRVYRDGNHPFQKKFGITRNVESPEKNGFFSGCFSSISAVLSVNSLQTLRLCSGRLPVPRGISRTLFWSKKFLQMLCLFFLVSCSCAAG